MKQYNYVKLIINRILDQIGNVFYDYANAVWIASMGSLGQKFLGIYQITETITSIIFNPIAGAVADNSKRKKVILITDIISAFICILISIIANDDLLLYGIIVANIILSITYAFSSTTFKSIVPNTIEKDRVLSFNSTVETILQIMSVISPLMTFYIYNAFGIRVALFINGISFIGSFFVILSIKEEETDEETEDDINLKKTFSELLHDIKDGMKYIIVNKDLLELLILSAIINFFLSFYNFLLPFSNTIFGHADMYSKLLTFGAIGSIVGAFTSKFIPNTRKYLLISLGFCGAGIVVIALPSFYSISLLISYIGNLSSMAFLTIYNIHFVSRIQNHVSDEYLGRVFSTVFTVAILFMPIGTFVISMIPLVYSGLMFLIVGLTIVFLSALTLSFR